MSTELSFKFDLELPVCPVCDAAVQSFDLSIDEKVTQNMYFSCGMHVHRCTRKDVSRPDRPYGNWPDWTMGTGCPKATEKFVTSMKKLDNRIPKAGPPL